MQKIFMREFLLKNIELLLYFYVAGALISGLMLLLKWSGIHIPSWILMPVCSCLLYTSRQTAYNFKAVEHRIEYTATKKQVRYYNDSKGTNPDAAIQGIRAMTTPTCLIGGGYDKGSTYDEWIEAFGSTIKYLVLIGQTSKAIADCCEKHGFTNYEFAPSMEEAVEKCASHAKPGEAVLLLSLIHILPSESEQLTAHHRQR